LIFGFEETEDGMKPIASRPTNLAAYTPDTVNAVIAAYAEPSFHCDVVTVTSSAGANYPMVLVPGGHTVPISAKRDGPDGKNIRKSSYYIRRPGPLSEMPQTAQEWDTLIKRCLTNAREELADRIRAILSGGPVTPSSATPIDEVRKWMDESIARWKEVISETEEDSDARFPHGHFAIGYQLRGAFTPPTGSALRDLMQRGTIHHTGWPEFWVPTRSDIAPYPHNQTIECWIGRDGNSGDGAHTDFWRVAPEGKFFLIRGLQEDSLQSERGIKPGSGFEITTPTWRVGEAFLHAASMASLFGDSAATISIIFEWSGLNGRHLTTHFDPGRLLSSRYTAHQNSFQAQVSVRADEVADALPELVERVVRPLYEMFDFFNLPTQLVAQELTKMRGHQF
jgi:hypothetical protein